MGEGYAGMNAELRRWNLSTGAWEAIANLNNINWSGYTRASINTTPDLELGYQTFVPGQTDPGSIAVSANFTRDTFDTLKTDIETNSTLNYEVVLPDDDNTSLEVEGFIIDMSMAIPATKITLDFTIKISGEPTAGSGSGPSPG